MTTLRPAALHLLCPLWIAALGFAGCVQVTLPAEEAPRFAVQGDDGAPIIGGELTERFPAVGALTYQGQPFCTATLVGPTTLLTAAHCLAGFEAEELRFVLGADATAPQDELALRSLRVHTGYREFVHDIATAELAEPSSVPPLGLLRHMDERFVGMPLVFVGYGVDDGLRQTGGGHKRRVAVPIEELGPGTFRYLQRGGGTCNGDSGGPALHQDEEGRWLVAGVTSYGDVSCRRYGVDTRVDAYLAFVEGGPDADPEADGDVEPPLEAEPNPLDPSETGEQEPNDSRSEAQRITAPAVVVGTLGRWGDNDWLRVVVPARGRLEASLAVPPDQDFDLALYGADGRRISESVCDAGLGEALTFDNDWARSRVLYLLVYGYERSWSWQARYRLTLSAG